MAWRARVARKAVDQQTGMFKLDVEFFDDSDPATVVSRQALCLSCDLTAQEIQDKVRGLATSERAKFAALRSLDARFPLGSEISV